MYAFAKSVFPNSQNKKPVMSNPITKKIKKRVENTSDFAQIVANFKSSIFQFVLCFTLKSVGVMPSFFLNSLEK